MSAPVDVLSAMDEATYCLNLDERDTAASDLSEARAAVAELIEAVNDVYGDYDHASCSDTCPTCRIRAALAGVSP